MSLHKDTFHILVALAAHDRHGYSIMQDIAARTDGQIKLSPSTLYSAIKRMLEDGLIVISDAEIVRLVRSRNTTEAPDATATSR